MRGSGMASWREKSKSSLASVLVFRFTLLTRLHIYWSCPYGTVTAMKKFWSVKLAFVASSAYELFCMKFLQFFQNLHYATASTQKPTLIKLDLLQSWSTSQFSLISFKHSWKIKPFHFIFHLQSNGSKCTTRYERDYRITECWSRYILQARDPRFSERGICFKIITPSLMPHWDGAWTANSLVHFVALITPTDKATYTYTWVTGGTSGRVPLSPIYVWSHNLNNFHHRAGFLRLP